MAAFLPKGEMRRPAARPRHARAWCTSRWRGVGAAGRPGAGHVRNVQL